MSTKILSWKSTRYEELEVLASWKVQAGNGSFLSAFLSDDTNAYVEEAIRYDTLPNISGELKALRKQNEDFEAQIKEQKDHIDTTQINTEAILKARDIRFEAKQNELTESRKMIDLLQDQLSERSEINNRLLSENSSLKDQVVTLKAKLYDLMTA